MSLYHEAAAVLTGSGNANAHAGGSFKSRVFGNKDLKSPPAQVYALALESCKWSGVLKEVVENSGLLAAERKLTPALAILLTHDLLVSKSGNGRIALPETHGLRQSIERHKARLASEFTRARLRRKCATFTDLRNQVEHEYRVSCGITIHPRWIRVNTLRSTVDEQLETTFKGWEVLPGVAELLRSCSSPSSSEGVDHKKICLDANVPNLIAVSPLSGVDFTRTEAYKQGKIILQDKASCFPAYLLDPHPDPEAGDVIDACSAPGNKTTHLAAILAERDSSLLKLVGKSGDNGKKRDERKGSSSRIFAFEKDKFRAKTLEKMVGIAGSDGFTVVNAGVDFLKVDPNAEEYSRVGVLLLDPSCSGSGIVGRDVAPELHLPALPGGGGGGGSNASASKNNNNKNKRKRDTPSADEDGSRKKPALSQQTQQQPMEMIDDDGKSTIATSTQDLQARISALASFQLTLLLHAFTFPKAKRITYSTCSIYAGENEHVVIKALNSDIARQRGWKILKRSDQVSGMREWDVRGSVEACEGFEGCAGEEAREIAEACVRAYNVDDGRGVMGFFVAGFVRDRDGGVEDKEQDDGPFVRDEMGRIIRDENGVPTLKSTGEKAFDLDEMMGEEEDEGSAVEYYVGEGGGEDGPFVRDENGIIVRDAQGMPTLKEGSVLTKKVDSEKRDEGEEKKKSKKKKKNKNKKKGKAGGQKNEFEEEGGDDEWDGFGD
ncbi:S-adenosyl-L-methionine-dependent methyltransferase [Naviculisporaceae sp. PSN 640]